MDRKSNTATGGSNPPGAVRTWNGGRLWRMAASGAVGLIVLLAFVVAGGHAKQMFHLRLPGPVIGLALLAAVFLLVERFHAWSHRNLTLHVEPVSRLLVAHMGLLFVPAGVGIIAEGETLRREWLPLIAAVIGSTWIGLVATGWFMHRFAARQHQLNP